VKLLSSVFAAIAAIALAPHNAQASSYSNASGFSQLAVAELRASNPNISGGYYITKIGTTNWNGRFITPTVTTSGGTTSYTGTFSDSPFIAGTTVRCKGTIKLDRTLVAGQYNLSVKWMVTGGAGCPFVGSNPTLLLKESLPIANASGDFNPSNSTTLLVWANSQGTWPKWKVVDPTGLNCRVTPGSSSVLLTLPVSTVIDAAGFHPNGTWLQTYSDGTTCYVRANSTYIKPVQIPF
jgi:hypothetical protein